MCLRTLQRFCKFYGIDPSPKKVAINSWYNPQLSVSENFHIATLAGIKISKSALYKYCHRNGLTTKATEVQPFAIHP